MDDELNLNVLVSTEDKEIVTKVSEVSNETSVFSLPESGFDLSLRITTFASEKDFDSFIKNVERLVRYSQEYKLWVKYITDHLGQSHCALTNESINECPIEIHHHPINLYSVVKSIINDRLSREMPFSSFDIATKVIELHFQNKIGYVVLLSDLHKKYHSGFLNVPIELVNGDYKYIMQHYSIDENEYDKICCLCNVHIEDMKQVWGRNDYPGVKEHQKEKELPAEPIKKELIA